MRIKHQRIIKHKQFVVSSLSMLLYLHVSSYIVETLTSVDDTNLLQGHITNVIFTEN